MLMAQLRGKTRDEAWLTSEDLLTSAVFGTLKNLPDEIAIGLLATAQAVNGAGGPTLQRPLRWTFWPWWDNCEPDVVVEDEHSIVVIEVKLNAEFGTDTGQGPQLEREWRAGSRRAHVSSKKLFLITVTNHTMPPSTVILQQLAGTQAPTDQVAWLGWQDIVRYIAGLRARPQISGWADDLLALFDRMALRLFQGFGQSVDGAEYSIHGYLLAVPNAGRNRVGKTRVVQNGHYLEPAMQRHLASRSPLRHPGRASEPRWFWHSNPTQPRARGNMAPEGCQWSRSGPVRSIHGERNRMD
jgi:hypothetical protein